MCIDVPTPKVRTKVVKHGAKAARPLAEPELRYRTNKEILGLLRDFKEAKLPREEWTHAAHLIVALCYARLYPAAEALTRLKAAIQSYNVATAKTKTQATGYHETITLAWFHLVRHFLDVFEDGRSLPALADALVELYSKDELWKHYSRDRLLGADARAAWVAPDLEPLPVLEAFTRQDRNWLKTLKLQPKAAPQPVLQTVFDIAATTAAMQSVVA